MHEHKESAEYHISSSFEFADIQLQKVHIMCSSSDKQQNTDAIIVGVGESTVLQQVQEEVDDECTSLSIESSSINSDSKHKRRRHHRCYYCPNYINNTIIAKCKGSIYLAFISHVCFITASLFYLKLGKYEIRMLSSSYIILSIRVYGRRRAELHRSYLYLYTNILRRFFSIC